MAQDPWNLKLAGHLLRRATFGFTFSQLQQALHDGPQKTLDRLLAPPPDDAEFEQTMAALTPREPTPQQTAQLQLYRILNTPYPLRSPTSSLSWSDPLFAPETYRTKVKSPLEFALNLAIPLEVQLAPAQLLTQLAALGQNSIPGPGKRWLNAFTFIGRSNLAANILSKVAHFPGPQTLIDTLLQNDAPPAVLQGLARLEGRGLAQAIANLPEFQLL